MQRRLWAFAVGLLAAGLLLVWAGWIAWRSIEQLSHQLSRDEIESFEIGDEFTAELRTLQGVLLRYQINRDAGDWERFAREGPKLDQWLDKQRGQLARPIEHAILGRIDDTFARYRDAARAVHEAVTHPATTPFTSTRVESVEAVLDELWGLDTELQRAHAAARESAIRDGQARLTQLLGMVVGAFLLLMCFAALLAGFVWRDLVRPLQRQLVESRDLLARQEKLASLGELAAGVAHEIRNPLTAIKARLFTQEKTLTPNSAAASDARVIAGEIDRLERIVRGILEFARPPVPHLEPIHLCQLAQEVIDLLSPNLANRQIELRWAGVAPVAVRADPALLKQVLINLVQNAAESIPLAGQITIRTRAATGRLPTGQAPVAVLEITDTGPGIPAAIRSRLFDPFFTTKEHGTGLGLSIAARIIEMHHGAIELQTEPGVGSTFAVLLPLVVLPAKSSNPTRP